MRSVLCVPLVTVCWMCICTMQVTNGTTYWLIVSVTTDQCGICFYLCIKWILPFMLYTRNSIDYPKLHLPYNIISFNLQIWNLAYYNGTRLPQLGRHDRGLDVYSSSLLVADAGICMCDSNPQAAAVFGPRTRWQAVNCGKLPKHTYTAAYNIQGYYICER